MESSSGLACLIRNWNIMEIIRVGCINQILTYYSVKCNMYTYINSPEAGAGIGLLYIMNM